MMEWLSMGGYGAYVWSAYGIAGAILIINILWGRFRRKRIQHKLKQFFIRESA